METTSACRPFPGLPALCAIVILACMSANIKANAQKMAVKTYFAYWATTTPNVGFETALSGKWTIDLNVGYNPFTLDKGDNRKLKHVLVMPEARYWLCNAFQGHFFGLHTGYSHYNLSGVNIPIWDSDTRDHRYQGWATGVGLSYGYEWILGKRWNLEASIGIGYVYSNYDKYDCVKCGNFRGSNDHHYFGPTKVSVSIVYLIK